MRRCGAGLRLLHEKRCPDGFPFIPGAALTNPGSLGPAAKPARYPRSRNTPYVLEQPAQSLGGLHHALAAAGCTASVLTGRGGGCTVGFQPTRGGRCTVGFQSARGGGCTVGFQPTRGGGCTAGVLTGRGGDSNRAARTTALYPPPCPAAPAAGAAAWAGRIRLSLRLAPEGTAGAVGRGRSAGDAARHAQRRRVSAALDRAVSQDRAVARRIA